jgi:hypothetical protein
MVAPNRKGRHPERKRKKKREREREGRKERRDGVLRLRHSTERRRIKNEEAARAPLS